MPKNQEPEIQKGNSLNRYFNYINNLENEQTIYSSNLLSQQSIAPEYDPTYNLNSVPNYDTSSEQNNVTNYNPSIEQSNIPATNTYFEKNNYEQPSDGYNMPQNNYVQPQQNSYNNDLPYVENNNQSNVYDNVQEFNIPNSGYESVIPQNNQSYPVCISGNDMQNNYMNQEVQTPVYINNQTYDNDNNNENVNVITQQKNKAKFKERNTKYPSMKIRFKAAFIDFIISTFFAVILFFQFLYPTIMNIYNLFDKTGGKTYLDLAFKIKGQLLAYIIFIIIINLALQLLIPLLLKGQTIGKRIVGIKVVSDFVDETDIPTPMQIFKREVLGKAIGFLTLGLCFIPSKKKDYNVGLPDTLAKTHVVFGNGR